MMYPAQSTLSILTAVSVAPLGFIGTSPRFFGSGDDTCREDSEARRAIEATAAKTNVDQNAGNGEEINLKPNETGAFSLSTNEMEINQIEATQGRGGEA